MSGSFRDSSDLRLSELELGVRCGAGIFALRPLAANPKGLDPKFAP